MFWVFVAAMPYQKVQCRNLDHSWHSNSNTNPCNSERHRGDSHFEAEMRSNHLWFFCMALLTFRYCTWRAHNIDPEAQWFCFPFWTSPLRPSAESIAKRHWKHCGDRPHRRVLWMQTKFGSRFSLKESDMLFNVIKSYRIQMCPATDQRSPRLREFPEEFGQKIDTLNVSCDVLFVDGQFYPYRSPTYHITYTWIIRCIRKWWNVPMFSQKSTSKLFKLHVKCTKFLPKCPLTSLNCFLGHSSLVSSPLSAQGGWTQYGATWVAFRFKQSALESVSLNHKQTTSNVLMNPYWNWIYLLQCQLVN